MSKKIDFTNCAGNLVNELIRTIYRRAHELEANVVVVKEAKYNKCAVVDLYEEPYGCIERNYTIEV